MVRRRSTKNELRLKSVYLLTVFVWFQDRRLICCALNWDKSSATEAVWSVVRSALNRCTPRGHMWNPLRTAYAQKCQIWTD